MKDTKFETGTIIKGKDLKDCILCKVLSRNMVMRGFRYKAGMNEDVNPLAMEGNYGTGLHFCLIKDICYYLDYGTKLAAVSIPDEEDIYVGDDWFRTHRLYIEKVMMLYKVGTWKYLYTNGLDITVGDNWAVKWAAEKGYLKVVRYLHRNGADITADGNHAARWAAKNEHMDVVKYLQAYM